MYKCEFPGCTMESEIETDLQKHHIIPQEHNGSNGDFNLIRLCKPHHDRIHIPNAHSCSSHSKIHKDSIICDQILSSTGNPFLFYHTPTDSTERLHELDSWRKSSIKGTK